LCCWPLRGRQDRQEKKWAFELNIVVDVIGQYVLNANGDGKKRGGGKRTGEEDGEWGETRRDGSRMSGRRGENMRREG